MIDQNLDRPEESTATDITLVMRGVTVTACVEVSSTSLVVVRPSDDGSANTDVIQVGDPVELYWIGGTEERTLGGTVSAVEGGPEPRWHLAVSGRPNAASAARRSGHA
jgi:hypothetical protein